MNFEVFSEKKQLYETIVTINVLLVFNGKFPLQSEISFWRYCRVMAFFLFFSKAKYDAVVDEL